MPLTLNVEIPKKKISLKLDFVRAVYHVSLLLLYGNKSDNGNKRNTNF